MHRGVMRGENGSQASTSCTITLGSERSRFPMHESSGCNVRIVTDWKAAPVVGSCRMHQRLVLAAYHVAATGSVAARNTHTSADCHFWCMFARHALLCKRQRGVGWGYESVGWCSVACLKHNGGRNWRFFKRHVSLFDVCTCTTMSGGLSDGCADFQRERMGAVSA
jgi:hypothetical protein